MNDQFFDSFTTTSAGRRSATLAERHNTMLQALYVEVKAKATESEPHMIDGDKYTLAQMYGQEGWAGRGLGLRIAAGMCLSYLVRVKAVPLIAHTTRSGKGKRHYLKRPEQKAPDHH